MFKEDVTALPSPLFRAFFPASVSNYEKKGNENQASSRAQNKLLKLKVFLGICLELSNDNGDDKERERDRTRNQIVNKWISFARHVTMAS